MGRFMDVHLAGPLGLTPEQAAEIHQRDLAIQAEHGVRFLKYWYDPTTGRVYCLSEAPNKDAVNAVHMQAHGLTADEIFEVFEGE
jgi:hypothetical protein